MTNIIAISGKMGSGKDTIGAIIQYLVKEEDNKRIMSMEEYLESYDPTITKTGEWEIKKMAGKLKDVACLILGCTREDLEDRDFKEQPLGPEWDRYFTERNGEKTHAFGKIIPYFSSNQLIVPMWTIVKKESQLTVREFLQLLGTDAGRIVIHENIWVNAFWADYKSIGGKMIANPQEKHKVYPNWIITDCRFPNEAQSVKDRGGIIIRTERDNPNPSNHPSETGLDDYQDFDYIIDNNGSMEDLIEQVRIILIKEGIK